MTGWRIGYACGPSDLIQGLVRIHQYSIMSAPTTAQDAALEALKSGEPYVQEMVTEYDRRRRLLVAGLNRLGLRLLSRAARSTRFQISAPPAWTMRSSARNYSKRSMWQWCRATRLVPVEKALHACAMQPNTARSKKPCIAWKSL